MLSIVPLNYLSNYNISDIPTESITMGNPDKEQEAAAANMSSSSNEAQPQAPPPPYQEPDEPIPAYERPVMANMSQSAQTSAATVKMPPFLTCIHGLSLTTHHIGPDSKDKRYCVTNKTRETILHTGTDKKDPTLAQITQLRDQGGPYGSSAIYIPRQGAEPVEAVMTGDHSNRQPFSLPVGKGGRLEHFEWRQSQGNEVEEVGQTRMHGYGWKLVWLTGDVDGAGGKRKVRDFGFTSDGKEIVAAASHTSKFWKGPNLSFMGTGLTGTLGEVFELAVVVSFLRIFYLQNMRSSAGGAPWWYNKDPHPGMVVADGESAAGSSGAPPP